MNTVSQPMYGWNTLLYAGYSSSQSTSPKPYQGTDDSSQAIEEPDDANVSRPVLKPSGGGDPVA